MLSDLISNVNFARWQRKNVINYRYNSMSQAGKARPSYSRTTPGILLVIVAHTMAVLLHTRTRFDGNLSSTLARRAHGYGQFLKLP